ncbi:DUF6177 family protein [Streptomyces sp. NPDC002055]|uniref:DUF6177 family protein n=1 Tax=Streptomyces sp. NPDC002055 TaxID=3154534 RepID=UPI003322258A
MTKDVITLTPTMPDVRTLLAGLYAGGPDLGVRTTADGAVVQLCAPDGRTLVSVEAPVLVQVPGEVERLLGPVPAVPDGPVWWTEARASTAVPEAEQLAASFAGRLATVLDGTTWPPKALTTAVVPVPSGTDAPPETEGIPPAVDVLTEQAAVVFQDRPVVAMTSWLSDALRTAITSDRALQIVTPDTTRLTLPARAALGGHPHRWVVQDGEDGYYDGLSGAVLHWQGDSFAPARTTSAGTPVAAAFADRTDSGDRQLVLSLRTRHPADEHLVLGRALEAAWHHITGAAPAGWSTAEPVNHPWTTRQLTDLARRRAPQPTWFTVVGHPDRPALATLRVTRTTAGVEEEMTLAVGHGPAEDLPLGAVLPLAEALSAPEHGLTSMLATVRRARRDLTVPAHIEAPPVPVSFTLGPDPVQDIGLPHARRPPHDLLPAPLGPSARPALHYPLGDGTDPQTWTALRRLTQHLRAGS